MEKYEGEDQNPELTRKLKTKKSIRVDDFMGEEEEDTQFQEKTKEPKKVLDLSKIVSQFILKKELFIKEREGDIHAHYDFSEPPIGQGAFGEVYKGVENKTKEIRAIKKIAKAKIKNPQRFFNEIMALKTLDHPNVIKLYESFEDKENVYLVQEFCDGGELFDYIVEQDHLTEHEAALLFKEILLSLVYCHKNKICHRDLKPENFMLSKKGDKINVKLIDFGLSRSFYKMETSGKDALLRMKTKVGTAFFMAPEVIRKDYSNSCDMWSAGCILYIMLSGYPPFDGDNEKEIYDAIEDGEYDFEDPIWDDVSDEAKMFISKLLCSEEHRMTAKKALKHPWIKKNIEKQSSKTLSTAHMNRLKNFHSKKKLRQAVLTFLAARATDEEISEQTKLFHELDGNNDGYITLKELNKGLQDSYAPEEIQAIMDSVDTDKNGAINFNEFIAATLEPKVTKDMSRIEQAFKFFDHDNNGFIDASELKNILSDKSTVHHMATKNIEGILLEADEDGNGQIDMKEFMRLMSVVPK